MGSTPSVGADTSRPQCTAPELPVEWKPPKVFTCVGVGKSAAPQRCRFDSSTMNGSNRRFLPQASLGSLEMYTLFSTAIKTIRLRVDKLPTPTDSVVLPAPVQRSAIETAGFRAAGIRPYGTQNVYDSTFLTKSLSKPSPECPLQSLRRQLPPQGSLGMYPFWLYVDFYCFRNRQVEGRQVADPYGGERDFAEFRDLRQNGGNILVRNSKLTGKWKRFILIYVGNRLPSRCHNKARRINI